MDNINCRAILISIRPRYSRRIFAGHKVFEFRRRRVNVAAGADLFIYETSPTMAVVGHCIVGSVIQEPVDALVLLEENLDERRVVAAYLQGALKPCALELCDPVQFSEPVTLASVGVRRAPQSYTLLERDQV